MSKKIFVVTASPRKRGNSTLLAESFVAGAVAAGNSVSVFDAAKTPITGCTACNMCWKQHMPCVCDDDFNKFAQSVIDADILVIATPVYWGTYPAQLKAYIDKMYSFAVPTCEVQLSGKEFILLSCADGEDESAFEVITALCQGFADYMQWTFRDKILVPRLVGEEEILETDALSKAKELGESFTMEY